MYFSFQICSHTLNYLNSLGVWAQLANYTILNNPTASEFQILIHNLAHLIECCCFLYFLLSSLDTSLNVIIVDLLFNFLYLVCTISFAHMASLLLRISSVQKYMISMSILVRPFLNNILYERTGNFLCLLQIAIFWLSPMSDSSIAHYSCHSKYSYCFTLQTYFWCCIPSSRSSGTVLTQNFFNVFLSSVSRYRFPLRH